MTGLPPGWLISTIGAVTQRVAAVDPKLSPEALFTYVDIGSVDNSNNTIAAPKQVLGRDAPSRARQLLKQGDTVFSTVRTYLRNIGYVDAALDGAVGSTGFCVLRGAAGINGRYLYYHSLTDNFVDGLSAVMRGTSYPAVVEGQVRQRTIAVAPTSEQERIVAAIEAEFARINAGMAAVERVQQRLKTLLGVAMDKVVAGAISDPAWKILSPAQVADNVPNALAIGPFGSNLKVSDYRSEGVPLIFVRNIRERAFSGARLKFVARDKADELRSHAVRGGDVLITKMGDPPGDTAVYPQNLPNAILTADCIKLTPGADFDAHYLSLVMRTRQVREQFLAATRGVAQQKLSLDRFKKQIHLPVPEFQKQREIVQRMDLLASAVTKCAAEMNQALRMSRVLRSAVLVAAFSGRLVRQDPKDEPASRLLERIAAEWAESDGHPKTRARRSGLKVNA